MLNNLTTEEKYVLGGTALLLGAIAFVKPVRKTIGLSDRYVELKKYNSPTDIKIMKRVDKLTDESAMKRLYKIINGKEYFLQFSGTKTKVQENIKKYGIPDFAKAKQIKVGNEYRLYLTKK